MSLSTRVGCSAIALVAVACSGGTSITQVNAAAASGGSSNGGVTSSVGGSSAKGGASASGGQSTSSTVAVGGTAAVAGSSAVSTTVGGTSTTGGATSAATSTAAGTTTGGVNSTGSSTTGGSSTGGAATGGARTGGSSSTGGISGSGGAATGGAATGGAATGGTSAAGTTSCDTNGDGLVDNSSCITSPTYLRFVNTSASLAFDVYITGASKPVVTNLVPWQVFVVGPVQAGLIDYEFRTSGLTPIPGEVNTLANNRYSIVVYLDPTVTPAVLKTSSGAQLMLGSCGTTSAQVAFGQFTTIATNPAVILYTSNGGTSWVAPISPGLTTGQIFGSGCWGSTTLQFGAGPSGATTPTLKYQSTSFTATLTYQLLMTDDRIIRIDNLDRVTNLPKL